MAHTVRDKKKILARVNRIKGQLEAFSKAIDSEKECYEIMQLLASCRGAVYGLMEEIVAGHITEHIAQAKSKTKAAEAGKELVDVMKSFLK